MDVLKIGHVSKHFGGVAALSDCTLALGKGKVTGIIGPNGAGKTTLLNVISGLVKPDTGSVYFDGHDITSSPTHQIASFGLVRTFQIVRELGGLTVLENLLLAPPHQVGEKVGAALFLHRAVRQQDQENAARAREILVRLGLWHLADRSASALSGGQKKLLELARVLLLNPKLILLDEPAAGVAPPLLKDIIRLIRELNGEGISFGIVEHDMHLIGEVCHDVHVLAEGRTLVSGSFADVTSDERVIDAYLGMAL
ncbi:ABC transporter ATP-binding protein [Bradyrhizobium canariense]|nr:ATP-binding cassette domain-containing protein [Bradyrhizobium canariense]